MGEQRQRKAQAGVNTHSPQEHEEYSAAETLTRYTSRGAIPPVLDGFRKAGTTASTRAYGAESGRATSSDAAQEWAEKGNSCEQSPRAVPAESCFLTDGQRNRYTQRFQTLVTRALAAYQDALSSERVDLLLQKDEEVSVIGSMLLSLVGLHFVGQLSGALLAAKQEILNRLFINEVTQGSAERLISSISDQRIQSWTAIAFEPVKSTLAKPGSPADANHVDSATNKQQTLSFLGQLKRDAGVAFNSFEGAVLAGSDADLLIGYFAMQPELHDPEKYKDLVHDKVQAFKKSGVMEIGHKNVMDRRHDGTLNLDTRVVYVKQSSGTHLWYEKQKSIDVGFGIKASSWAGGFDRHLDRRVPDDFVDIALARSEARWGRVETIEDPANTFMQQHGYDTKAKPLPANSIFAHAPQPAVEQVNAMPSNSVFAPDHSQAASTTATTQPSSAPNPLAPFQTVKI